jgi:hypothetical protein
VVYQILKAKTANFNSFAVLAADMMCEHKHAILQESTMAHVWAADAAWNTACRVLLQGVPAHTPIVIGGFLCQKKDP